MKHLIGDENDLDDRDAGNQQSAQATEEEEQRKIQLVGIMRTSEEYYQNNMNGCVNNMALASAGAYELATLMK